MDRIGRHPFCAAIHRSNYGKLKFQINIKNRYNKKISDIVIKRNKLIMIKNKNSIDKLEDE